MDNKKFKCLHTNHLQLNVILCAKINMVSDLGWRKVCEKDIGPTFVGVARDVKES